MLSHKGLVVGAKISVHVPLKKRIPCLVAVFLIVAKGILFQQRININLHKILFSKSHFLRLFFSRPFMLEKMFLEAEF